MSTLTKYIWIDDNPGRELTAKDLGAKFINLKGRDPAPILKTVLDGAQPGLVIIDHVLDKAAADSHPLFMRGSTIAEAIKERWPSCPVVGVTNADKLAGIDARTKGTYDVLFPFQNFAKYFDRIGGIARGFNLIRKSDSSPTALIKLLRPPSDQAEPLSDCLTDDLKAPEQDESAASRMYSWVERVMDRPGFLYDLLWSSTHVGLNEAGFARVSESFKNAKYGGLFARPDDPRWWSSKLSFYLYRLCLPGPGELSWHAGRRLPGLKKEHFSVCYVCAKEFPEVVAFLDEASSERRAMHLKCTMLHPLHKRELYFEDFRIMKAE